VGFERTVKAFTLVFDQAAYAGLEVRMRSLPAGRFLEVAELASAVQEQTLAQSAGQARQLLGHVAACLVSWNLTDDGKPVPATAEGLLDQEFEFVLAIAMAWMNGVAGVSPPLQDGSRSGEPSLEASLPMAPLSPNPAS